MRKFWLVGLLFSVFSIQLNSKTPMSKHVVKKGETLYSISKQYGLTLKDLEKANSLSTKNPHIKVGQNLIVPSTPHKLQAINYKPISVPSTPDTPYREEDTRQRRAIPAPVKAVAVENPQPLQAANTAVAPVVRTSYSPAEYPAVFNQYPTQGMKMKKNKGAANYIEDATSGNQNLAFYNDAEMGSIVRVTNLMNHKTVFVKVLGKVPPNDASQEITIKLSNKSARDLGAIDEKFLVEVAAYTPD